MINPLFKIKKTEGLAFGFLFYNKIPNLDFQIYSTYGTPALHTCLTFFGHHFDDAGLLPIGFWPLPT
jgi:hypothetical protein